ncbi:MAG: FtsW/RodA/SpoVE family cell cycle protein [Minisyncoccia bacterium]|jgi:rod shape determining protein RodA
MKQGDRVILISLIILSIFSLIILLSLSKNEKYPFITFKKQLFYFAIGFILFFIFSYLDWRIFFTSSTLLLTLYLISIFLLGAVLLAGKTLGGARGWFNLGFFNLQPLEFAKIIVILVLAKYLSARHLELWQFKYLFVSGLYAFLPALLVILQPDMGGAIILISIWFMLVLASGIRWSQIFILLGSFLIITIIAWSFILQPYQKNRILNFLNPQKDITGIGYNRRQALISIGSGKIFGKGLGWGTQTQLNFLPLSKTDFFFAALCEELGLIGAITILGTFLTLFFRLSYWLNVFNNNFAKLFTFGILIKILMEVFINIGMNSGILPIIGIALPFLSYGGSHLLADFIGLGIINSMIRYRA